jgi:glucose/arabinose dehydrogenase
MKRIRTTSKFLKRGLVLVLTILPALSLQAEELSIKKDAPLSQQVFWRRRPELLAKIRDEREVVVSVRRETVKRNDEELESFTMTGGGYVERTKDFCFNVSQQYEKLKEVSDHFHTVRYTPSNRQLFVITQALGYQARMILQMQPVSEDWRSELQWEVIWGHFKGMKGLIGFERIDDKHTEVSLNAKYEAKELPLPKILMGFALEVITKKVAEKMRVFIEAQPAIAAEPARTATATPEGVGLIKLPEGFSISVFASGIKSARQMALSPEGTLYVGSRDAGKVYALPGAGSTKGEWTGKLIEIATGLNEPNGVAFHKGSLYVAEVSRILRFDKIEGALNKPPKPFVLREDYPKDKWHGWKYISVGPDGWLYVPVGAPCNKCVIDDPVYASITRLSLDGKKREIVAHGVRNSVGFDWNPATRQLWFTDNGADMMGDDQPSDELNVVTKPGLRFGFPYCHEGRIKDDKFAGDQDCSAFKPPRARLGAHTASLGMKFYRGSLFPREYRGRIFIAQHGSWNRSKKVGYRLITVDTAAEGGATVKPFADGWLQGESAWGRPVDIIEMPDGSLLVSDDEKGQIYRISYSKGK